MTTVVGRIMCKGTYRKRILVEILSITKQRSNEVAAAKIVRQIAEKPIAVRIVTHVLDD